MILVTDYVEYYCAHGVINSPTVNQFQLKGPQSPPTSSSEETNLFIYFSVLSIKLKDFTVWAMSFTER